MSRIGEQGEQGEQGRRVIVSSRTQAGRQAGGTGAVRGTGGSTGNGNGAGGQVNAGGQGVHIAPQKNVKKSEGG